MNEIRFCSFLFFTALLRHFFRAGISFWTTYSSISSDNCRSFAVLEKSLRFFQLLIRQETSKKLETDEEFTAILGWALKFLR